MSSTITEEDRAAFLAALAVDDATFFRAMATPQRTAEWHGYRKNRLTASNFGYVLGHNSDRKSEGQVLHDMLWGSSIDSEAMEYGRTLESTAFEVTQIAVYEEFVRDLGYEDAWIEETGICLSREHPFLAASPDGLLFAVGPPPGREPVLGTLEIKCRRTDFFATTPPEYYDQFQGQAGICGTAAIRFVVYTQSATQYNRYSLDVERWQRDLAALSRWYHERYLPRAIYQRRGLLRAGCIDVYQVVRGIDPDCLVRPKRARSTAAAAAAAPGPAAAASVSEIVVTTSPTAPAVAVSH